MTLLRNYAHRSAVRPSVPETCAQEHGAAADPGRDDSYSPPVVVDLGHVREVTLGSSSSGTADANSHYYW
ncbi:lasso RiPP family leader peptide-containing protein [Streptomyces chryseus]